MIGRSFFVLNVALAVAWVGIAVAIVRAHRRLTPPEKAAALG